MDKEESNNARKKKVKYKHERIIQMTFPICNMKSFGSIYLQKSLKTEFCIKIAYKKSMKDLANVSASARKSIRPVRVVLLCNINSFK